MIDYWIDLIDKDLKPFKDKEKVKAKIKYLEDIGLFNTVTIKKNSALTGVFAYIIFEDFRDNTVLTDIVFYVKPEFRGDLRLIKQYVKKIEKIAKDNGCKTIYFGGNIGYKDDSYLKLLKRWGYADGAVKKEI